MDTRWDGLLHGVTLATASGGGYGLVVDAALAWREGHVAYAGPSASLPDVPERCARDVRRLDGALVTPGLVDCHTHVVFGGDRANEFERRLEGATYEQIARDGGGIASTVRATRAASEDELLAQSLPRARDLVRSGATTLEVKSGYGLDLDSERRMLRVARRLGDELGIAVRTTFLGLHALPPEARAPEARAAWVRHVVHEWLPALHAEGLVDAVDAYCEGIGFTIEECEALLDAARTLGVPAKLHADQLSDMGAAALAADRQALSADHVEYTSDDGVAAMAAAGTVAVLLPGAFYALRETKLPPIAAFRARGVPMAVASDCNPGTSPLRSMTLAMNLACTLLRLTPEEAFRGATVHAARALGLAGRKGVLVPGADADFAVWDVRHPAELCYWIGGALAREVHAGGNRVA
ncbi:MAG TPA: imidazolonepropionase [Xanthomonadales bacterium]|nr:imidazolonepropionase [Xanthomonadales bacterium]